MLSIIPWDLMLSYTIIDPNKKIIMFINCYVVSQWFVCYLYVVILDEVV